MNELSFNISIPIIRQNELSELSEAKKYSNFYLKNFMTDFMLGKCCHSASIWEETKSEGQKKFEKFLIEKNIIIIDYMRTIKDVKYFYTLSNYMNARSDKQTVLYSSKDLSYMSANCSFFKYDIPKNASTKHFENIYNYLFKHSIRQCWECNTAGDPFYYCTNCGEYTCKKCVYKKLKVVLWKDEDIYYIHCRCDAYHTLYRLPAYHTPF